MRSEVGLITHFVVRTPVFPGPQCQGDIIAEPRTRLREVGSQARLAHCSLELSRGFDIKGNLAAVMEVKV